MMKNILEIQNISKKFLIYHERQPYLSVRESISSAFSRNGSPSNEEFWALKDVSFDVSTGDSIGIIGKNGAGKSTLLKILSRITPPTEGKITARGRVASLLEVGTGFHPELTGRENIFLNGSILGMKRKEIILKFAEIVDFSGVEKFLDTPLKHFSSGMQLRLAFAVAAFLDPEILIIDEVLAVGDAEFQKKCLGKMSEVSQSGRTLLFVSHNLPSIKALCNKGMLLRNGLLETFGGVHETVNQYLSIANSDAPRIKCVITDKFRKGQYTREVEIVYVEMVNPVHDDCFASDEPLKIKVQIRGKRNLAGCRIAGSVFNDENTKLGTFFGDEIIDAKADETTDVYID
ncbi:MAG: ABC transporter ATP-binding protein, partial [Bacteroidia bacterium]|nr:ABC transporter ATP-binding protein [Bacteroidia bacterium]